MGVNHTDQQRTQKDLRPRHYSIRRGGSDSALTIFSGQYLESYFEERGQFLFLKSVKADLNSPQRELRMVVLELS